MRYKYFIMLFLLILLPLYSFAGENGFTVSFHSGLPLSGTNFGFKFGSFAPYVGIDIVRVGGEYSESSSSWETDYYSGSYYKYSDEKSEFSGSAMLFVPQLGVRFYLTEKTIKSYIKSDFLFVIPFVNGKTSGEEIDYNPDGTIDYIDKWDEELSEREKDVLNDALDMFGFSLGYGLEYAFSEHFSIGGEFGFRFFANSVEDTYSDSDDYDDDGKPDWKDEWENKIDVTLGMTYTNFFLTYYF